MRKFILYAVALLALSGFSACGSGEKVLDSIEAGEEVRSYEEAAVIEGRNAARAFLTQSTTDTMAMQKHLLDARALQSKYVVKGQKEAAEAFDTAFIHTLRAVRPELATQIEEAYSK